MFVVVVSKRVLGRALLAVFLALAIGCTDERPQEFSQGQGENLDTVAAFQGKKYTLTTGAARASANISAAAAVNASDTFKGVNNFDIVYYQTNSDLLGDVPFWGRANTKYEIEYVVSDKYLKIYKVADKKDIPYHEYSYAIERPGNRLAVPLVGYSISLYRVEAILDGNNEGSHKNTQIRVPSVGEASHVYIDHNSRTLFQSLEKKDVLPKDIFDGEWFYANTIIESRDKRAGAVGFGYAYNFDENRRLSNTIKFIKGEDFLIGVNSNLDPRLSKSELKHFKTIKFNVQWQDYRAALNGKEDSLREESINHLVNWDKRRYVKIDFARMWTKNNSELKTAGGGGTKVEDVEYAHGYISFTLKNLETGRREKHAFYRKDVRFERAGSLPYQKRIAFAEDRKIFGYYFAEKDSIDNYQKYSKKDYDNKVFLERFNPNAKKVVYHISQSSPKSEMVMNLAKKTIEGWNEAFKEAGTDMEIVLSRKRVRLGDIRYNILNFVDELKGSNLLGFGPTISDPNTGEIISATSNIYLVSAIGGQVANLREYISEELEEFQNSFLHSFTGFNVSSSDSSNRLNSPASQSSLWDISIPKKLEESKGIYKVTGGATLDLALEALEHYSKLPDYKKNQELFDVNVKSAKTGVHAHNHAATQTVSREYMVKNVKKLCPELNAYIGVLKIRGDRYTDNQELAELERCAERMVQPDLLHTSLHELGHNFGLMHNFACSNDVKNFYSKEENNTDEQSKVACVMDYFPSGATKLTKPGKYDIAAIRFAYADKVDLQDGTPVKISPLKSIQESFSESRYELSDRVPYKYCSDVDASLAMDPMCARHDYGTTPIEVVRELIAQYNTFYASAYQRRGRYRYEVNGLDLARTSTGYFFDRLKQFYNQWRILLREHVGPYESYLESYDEESYASVLEEMKNDSVHGGNFAEYYELSREIYKFFKTTVFMPNKYCLLENLDSKKQRVLELDRLRRSLHSEASGQAAATSCDDPRALARFSKNNERLIKEFGAYNKDQRFSLKKDDITAIRNGMDSILTPYDISGSLFTRMGAAMTLLSRGATSFMNYELEFVPNFMDEPDLRTDFYKDLKRRMIDGVSFKGIDGIDPEKAFPRFRAEGEFVKALFNSYQSALILPENRTESMERINLFRVNPTDNPAVVQNAIAKIFVSGFYLVVMDKESTEAIDLMNRYNHLEKLKLFSEVTESDIARAEKALPSASPENYMEMTLSKAIKFHQVIDKRINHKDYKKVPKGYRYVLQEAYDPEGNMFALMRMVQSQYAALENQRDNFRSSGHPQADKAQEEFDKFKDMKFGEFFEMLSQSLKQQGVKSEDFKFPNRADVVKRFEEIHALVAESAEIHKDGAQEVDAQQEAILSAFK